MLSDLKCTYWNIHGVSSKSLGDKTKNTDFLKVVQNTDILCLSELHTSKSISVEGFSTKVQKFREKNSSKISGGIAVFIRHNLVKKFEIIKNSNPDSIWLKTTTEDDIVLHFGFFYCSPYRKQNDDFFDTINDEISAYGKNSNTFIFGDFNGRTKTMSIAPISMMS